MTTDRFKRGDKYKLTREPYTFDPKKKGFFSRLEHPAIKAERDYLDIKDPNAKEYMASTDRLAEDISFLGPSGSDRTPEMANTSLYGGAEEGVDAFDRSANKVSYMPEEELSMDVSPKDGFGDIDYATASMFASAINDMATRQQKSDLAQYDAIAKAFGVDSDLSEGFEGNMGGFDPFKFATRAKALSEMYDERDKLDINRARFGGDASQRREKELSKSQNQSARFDKLVKDL